MDKREQFYKLARLLQNTRKEHERAKILTAMLPLGTYLQLGNLLKNTSNKDNRAKILNAMLLQGTYQQLANLRRYTYNRNDRINILEAMLHNGTYEQLVVLRKYTSNDEDRAKILDAILAKTKVKKTSILDTLYEDVTYSSNKNYDVFIAHASEDKDFATPLANSLEQNGIKVWYDDFILKLGDSLQHEIDRGLANSRYGIVILSHHFFNKHWPQKELDGLAAKAAISKKVILPIWKNLTQQEVLSYSPTLAGLLATNTRIGIASITKQIKDIVLP
jgi:hypothetical protein